MAVPVIDNLLLPVKCILVLPDEGSETVGVIVKASEMGGGRFNSVFVQAQSMPTLHTHILFIKEMATEVNVDGIEYLAMHECAVVGLIPD